MELPHVISRRVNHVLLALEHLRLQLGVVHLLDADHNDRIVMNGLLVLIDYLGRLLEQRFVGV